MATRIVFELSIQDANAAVKLEELKAQLRELNKELRSTDSGSDKFKELSVQAAGTKAEIAKLTQEQNKLRKEFAATQLPKDSLAALRLEYSRLAVEVSKLSEAERKSSFGQSLVKNAASVKREIDGIEQSIGRFTGNVGNYKLAFNSLFDIAGGVLLGGGIANGIGLITDQMNKGIRAVEDYGESLSRLSAITGVTGEELEVLKTRAEELTTIDVNGKVIVNTATEIFEAFTLVGSARPELLKDADALQEVTKQAIVLSKASGDDLKTSVEAVTTTLGQFQLGADKSREIINQLAAGSKEGASEIVDTTQALQKFGTTAAVTNVSTAESVALIETLADRQLKGAEAGTQLRNILAKLAGADVLPRSAVQQLSEAGVSLNVLRDTSLPLADRLKELGKISGDTAALTKVFGLENLAAAQIITQGIPKYEELLVKIQGTDEAYKQAGINADNFKTRVENLEKQGINALTRAFLGLEPALSAGVEVFSELIELFFDMGEAIGDNKEEYLALAAALIALNSTTLQNIASQASLLFTTKGMTLANAQALLGVNVLTSAEARQAIITKALAAAQAAMPLLALVSGIYLVVKAFDVYNESLSAAEKASRSVADAQEQIAESSGREVATLSANIGVLSDAAASQQQRADAIKQLTNQYPEYLKGINLETQTSAQLAIIQKELTDQIVQQAAARAKSNALADISTQIVEKELKIAELRRKQEEGSFSFQDRSFIIQSEELRVKSLRSELEATGKKFDEVFKLGQPQESQVLTIIDPASLKKQADTVKEVTDKIAQDRDKLTDKEQKVLDKERRAREVAEAKRLKDLDDQQKAIEAQAKRIAEIRASIRGLEAKDENQFSAELTEIENRRLTALEKNAERTLALRDKISKQTGQPIAAAQASQTVTAQVQAVSGTTKADLSEAALIDEETAAINAAFDRQKEVVTEKRAEIQEEQVRALEDLRLEVTNIAAENAVKIAEAAQKVLDISFSAQRADLKRLFDLQNKEIIEGQISGDFSTEEADQLRLDNQIQFNEKSLALEREYASKVVEVSNNVRDTKIAASQATLTVELSTIERRRQAAVEALEKEQTTTGSDLSAQISAVNQKAAEEAKAAQEDFAQTVIDTSQYAKAAQLGAIQEVDDAQAQAHASELQRIEDERAKREEIKNAAIEAAGSIAGAIFQIEENRIAQEGKTKTDAINKEYEKRKEAAQGNAKLLAKLDKEQAAKVAAVEKEQAEKRKRIAIIEAVINTALAVVKAAPNPVLMALAAIIGAAQVAVIASQKFERGGVAPVGAKKSGTFGGRPHSAGGTKGRFDDGTEIEVEADEIFMILNKRASAAIRRMSDLNFQYGGKKFEAGGVMDFTPQISFPSASNTATQIVVVAEAKFSEEQISQIANELATKTATESRTAIANGLDDANRRNERETSLAINREG